MQAVVASFQAGVALSKWWLNATDPTLWSLTILVETAVHYHSNDNANDWLYATFGRSGKGNANDNGVALSKGQRQRWLHKATTCLMKLQRKQASPP